MAHKNLIIHDKPALESPSLLMGLTGWMDGGNVSTSSVQYMIDMLDAVPVAEIAPDGFYINNFPGTMEISAIFRPSVQIKDGVIESYDMPENLFFCSQRHNAIFMLGKEPNINWQLYTDCFFEFCESFGVERVYFIGSVAGLVPHTRQPRISCVVSCPEMKPEMDKLGLRFTSYEGPASIVTHLANCAPVNNVSFTSLVAEIPAYIQGHNPKCIDFVTKRLSALLGLGVEHEELSMVAEEFEKKVSQVVEGHPELAGHISKLEQDYDNDIFDTEMSDMKEWLEQQGIRVD